MDGGEDHVFFRGVSAPWKLNDGPITNINKDHNQFKKNI
jgi:hypothetical protein